MDGRRQKTLKLHRLKRPKTVPKKQNLDQNINDSKTPIWSLFFNFRFSSRKSQSQQKLAKNITRFTIKFRSKNLIILRTSTHSTFKKYQPKRLFTLQIF